MQAPALQNDPSPNLPPRLPFRPHQPELPPVASDRLHAYLFRVRDDAVVIAWAAGDAPIALPVPAGVSVRDLMGNRVDGTPVTLATTPLYLLGRDAKALRAVLENAAR